jgi:hypothetical protein
LTTILTKQMTGSVNTGITLFWLYSYIFFKATSEVIPLNCLNRITFEALTAVTMKRTLLRDVILSSVGKPILLVYISGSTNLGVLA